MEENKEPEKNSYKYSQLIMDKESNKSQWRKNNLFNKWCWFNWTSVSKKKKNLDAENKTFIKNELKTEKRQSYKPPRI